MRPREQPKLFERIEPSVCSCMSAVFVKALASFVHLELLTVQFQSEVDDVWRNFRCCRQAKLALHKSARSIADP